ncbi:MAG TPA: cation:proton antiporter, partial [Polyangiaceae bacterium]|nr:cation:proton antiporter [Polyangiaceae bacterium]
EAGLGAALGVLVPALFSWLDKRRFLAASSAYEPLAGVAVAAVIFGSAATLQVNEFLAAFAGGVTLATLRPQFALALRQLGMPIAEVLKLATLLVFGAVLSLPSLFVAGMPSLVFALVALLAARPIALVFALLGGGLTRKEWCAAAWFGPKGFASLLYALLLRRAGLDRGEWLFQTTALVIVLSIVAHSSSDVAVARVFRQRQQD